MEVLKISRDSVPNFFEGKQGTDEAASGRLLSSLYKREHMLGKGPFRGKLSMSCARLVLQDLGTLE